MDSSTPRYVFNLDDELEPLTTTDTESIDDSGESSSSAMKRKYSSSSPSFRVPLQPDKNASHSIYTSSKKSTFLSSGFPSASGYTGRSSRSTTPFSRSTPFMTPRGRKSNFGTPFGRRSQSATPYASSTSRRISSTPRRTTSSVQVSTPSVFHQSIIVAIVEGRGQARGEIGFASFDLKCPVLNLYQFADSQTYSKLLTTINFLDPLEIILPSTIVESGNTSKLFTQLNEFCSKAKIISINRKYFNDSKGLQFIKSLGLPECTSIESQLIGKYYALSATNALFKYVEVIQHAVIAPKTLKINVKTPENSTMIDWITTTSLELLKTNTDQKSNFSLFKVLNHTETTMGAKLLRANILQPPFDEVVINHRLDAVEELSQHVESYHMMRKLLSGCIDIDGLLSNIVHIPNVEDERTAENKLTTIIGLKTVVQLVPLLKDSLVDMKSPLLLSCQKLLESPLFELIANQILEVIEEDVFHSRMKTQKIFAVKDKDNDLLSILRTTYNEIMSDIIGYASELSRETGKMVRVSYNVTRGFHFVHTVPRHADQNHPMPDCFLKVTKNKNVISLTTERMMKYNDRIESIMKEIYLASTILLNNLLDRIRLHAACLHELAESVAMLDMLCSFVHLSLNSTTKYVRPVFDTYTKILEAHHPILIQMLDTFVPNPIFASSECNFIIISGANMSGKSTYLRQIALLQIMAQMGCNVPAEEATLKLANHIFTRFRAEQNIAGNNSSFLSEMKDINYIIANVTSNSLILIDELGRDTDSREGSAICFAICEHFLMTKAFTFLSTHYKLVMQLEDMYKNVINYHLSCNYDVNDLAESGASASSHKLQIGKTTESLYGLKLAEKSSLPPIIIKTAYENAVKIQEHYKVKETTVVADEERLDRMAEVCVKRLCEMGTNWDSSNVEELRSKMIQLKKDLLSGSF